MLHLTPLGEGFEMQTTDEEQRVVLRTIRQSVGMVRDVLYLLRR